MSSWTWIADNLGWGWAAAVLLAAGLVYVLRDYIPLYVSTQGGATGHMNGEDVKQMIRSQTNHLDERLDELTVRIEEVEADSIERDANIREWARQEFADDEAVERLRGDLRKVRSEMNNGFSALQAQFSELMQSLIEE